ncbi:hypothetical protein [Tsukamurella paurometabola]|uniref:Uncharacterized protein n=1 Tax=Tsukamurella paurometabola TaxID=2061 RepID=A0A3P8L3M5_TSUPA|nr:hypothetical protein [Tsukamurella paurometabola]MBS4100371.1 hypothetical protein [Tsukamurella paurometabola]UEA82726.1 Atu4866 domain-containing protein [Tsukamurella paurometabola]VDR39795.1 Uncharacterised protein [Tsukamurella paurometabola]
MTGFRRSSSLAVALIAAGALAGCSSDSGSDASPATAAPVSASVSAPAQSAAAIPAHVPGTYANGDWVVRLAADGTWEEDLQGRPNAYGGTYTVDGGTVVLRDRGGSSETATLQGDELRLPSITLTRR